MQENNNDPLGILSSKDPLGILKKKDGGGPKTPISTSQYLSPLPQEELPLGIPQQKRSVSQEALTAREKINKSISESDDILTRLIRENRLSAFETQQQATPQLSEFVNPAAQSAKRFLITQSPVTPDEVIAKKQEAMSDDKTAREVLKRVAKKDPTIASSAYIVDAQQRAVPEKENQILANADKIANGELTYNISKGILQQPQGIIESGIRGFKERSRQLEDYDKIVNAINPQDKIKILEEGFASYDLDKPVPVPEGASAKFAEMLGMEGMPMLKSTAAAIVTGLIPGGQTAAPLVAAFAASPEYYKRSYESGIRSAYYELRKRGKTPEEALAVAEDQAQKEGIIGAAEGAVSSALGARIGFKPPSIVSSPVMKGALGKAVSASANVVRQMAPEAAADAGAAGLLQIASNLTARDNGLDRGVFDGVQENIAGEVGFTIGMGILTKGGRRLVDRNTYRTILNGFARQPKDVTDSKLGEMIVTGAITPEDAVDVSREIEKERGLDAQIPKAIPETVRPQISEMVEKRDDLKQQLASANEAFHPTIKEEIKSIDQQILGYANGQVEEGQDAQPQENASGIKGEGAIITLAPFYNTTVSNTSDAKKIRETPEYKQYIDSIPTVAKALGLGVEIVNETIGGFVNSAGEKITEVSNKIFVANGTIDQAEEFGAIMGTMTPETQEATIAARYINEQEKDSVPADEYVEEIGIVVGDIDGALESLREAGIFDFTVDESKNTVSILDFSRGEDVAFDNNIANFVLSLKEKNISYGKEGRRPVNSRYIGPSRRTEILERIAGDATRLQQGGENLRSIITEARRRNQKFGEEEVARQDRSSQLETELKQDLVTDPISKAAQSLKSTGVSIDLIESPAEYDTMVEQLGGQRGTEGVFLSNEGRILLNKSKLNDAITAGRIIWHESSHPVINIIRNTNPELYNRVISGMKASDNPAVQRAIQWANDNYKGEGVIDDESIVEAIAMVADGTLDLNTVPTGLKQSIIDFINLIARAFNLGQISNTDVQEFKNLAGQIADALTSGTDIAQVVGRENVSQTQFNSIQARANEVFDGILDKIGISFGSVNKKTGNKKVTNFDVASALNKYYKKAFKTLRVDDFGKKALDIVSDYGTDEVIYAISKFGKESGKGWYTEDYGAALNTMQKLDPDIVNNPEIKEIATVVIAISSNSTDVATNLTRIIYAIDQYKKNNKIPTDVGTGKAIEAIASGVDRYNRLLQSFGGDVNALKDFLQTIRPVSESKKALIEILGVSSYAKVLEQDLGTNPEWNENEVLPTSVIIFGPKIGAFYSNLSGLGGTPTIDRWCIRTMYRYRGDMKSKVSSSDLEGFVKENSLEGQATGNIVALADAHGKLFNAILTGKGEYKGMSKQERNAALKPYRKGSQISDKLSGVVNDIKDGITDKVENAAKYSRDFRTFTKQAFEDIQKKVEERTGEKLDISDIQAILWIYEKNLFGAMGVKQREDSTYSAAANTLVNKVESGTISLDNLKAGKIANIEAEGVIEEGAMGDKIDVPVESYKEGLDSQPSRANKSITTQASVGNRDFLRTGPQAMANNIVVGGEDMSFVLDYVSTPSNLLSSVQPTNKSNQFFNFNKDVRKPVATQLENDLNFWKNELASKTPLNNQGDISQVKTNLINKLQDRVDALQTALDIWNNNAFSLADISVNKKDQASVGNRGQLLAPNGKPSNLTPKQYEQVRTPEFKNWFGDWENDPENASRVVDENGEPRVVYHGTNETFDEFKKEKLGSKNWMADSAQMGFFFAGSKKTSEAYTGMNSMDMAGVSFGQYDDIINKYQPELDKVKKDINDVFGRINREEAEKQQAEMRAVLEKSRQELLDNGLSDEAISIAFNSILDSRVDYNTISKLAETENENNGNTKRRQDINKKIYQEVEARWKEKTGANPQIMELFLSIKNPRVVDYNGVEETNLPGDIQTAIGTGKDGVIFNNLKDGAEADDIFVALSPNQIKSATANTGAFSTNDNRIQESVGNRPENNSNFKLGAFVMRKKAEGATDGEIAIAIASVTGMKPEDIKTLIDNPEQYIRDMFPSMSKLQQDNLIQKAKIQNIYRGRQFGKPIDKAFTGLEVPKEYVDEYMQRTAKSDNAVKEWATDFKNKWLDPAKGLPDWVLAIKDFASGSKNIEIARASKTIERLKDEAKKIGFTDWDSFGKALVVAKDVKRYIPNEDGVVPFDAYRAAAGKMFTTPDDMLPALVPDEIKALPDEIIPYVYAMRGQIDNLTRDLIGNGYVTPEQAVTLENNIGAYVNRSYRMFNEMGYKPEPEVMNAAIKFLADNKYRVLSNDYFYAQKGILPKNTLTSEEQSKLNEEYQEFIRSITDVEKNRLMVEAVELAKKDVSDILNKKKNPFFNTSVDRRNTGILQQRQEISEPIRKLMGEYTDPGTVFMMTVAKQAALKASSEYLSKLRTMGMGTMFFEKDDQSRPLSHSEPIATAGSESMNPLGGLYTTPEIAEAIAMVEPTYNNLTQAWMKLVGAVRWGKTVGSVATQFKNFESNLGFAVLNGYLMSGQNTESFKASAKYVKGQYSKAEIDAITDKAIRLNLVGQSVGAREIKEMLGSGDVHDIALDIALNPDGKWGKKVAKKLNVFKEANKLYRLGDDFWKVYAYMTEREQLSDARFTSKYEDLTKEQQEQIDVESSERVKNTWPTYDRVIEGAKAVSKRAPIFGNFISFQAESLRVLTNSIKMAKQDMADPQLRHLGVRRAVGIAAYFGLRSAITIGIAKMAGFAAAGVLGAAFGDDEEERNKRAIKQALPPFMRTSDLAVIRTKEPHEFTVISLSSLDPYAIIPNSMNAYTEGREGIFGKTMDPGVGAATAELFSSFLEPEMTFSTMWSVANNIDPKTKQEIVISSDTDAQAAGKVGGKVWDMLEPSSVALVQRFFERKDKEAEILAIGGARPYDVDLHKSFGYILSQFGKDIDAINREYNSIKYREEMSKQDKDAAEMAAEDKKAFAISKINETYRDFMNLGADPKVLNELINQRSSIKVTGFDKNTKNSIKTGKIQKEKLFK